MWEFRVDVRHRDSMIDIETVSFTPDGNCVTFATFDGCLKVGAWPERPPSMDLHAAGCLEAASQALLDWCRSGSSAVTRSSRHSSMALMSEFAPWPIIRLSSSSRRSRAPSPLLRAPFGCGASSVPLRSLESWLMRRLARHDRRWRSRSMRRSSCTRAIDH